jgi:CheY-like chemotaxis protein
MMPKLLLADDSITVQRVIALTFQGEGIEVIAVGDGDQAVAAIDRERPQIVLADLSMPGRDGYAVAEHVKRSPDLSRDTRVVLLTGAAEPVEESRSSALGIDGVLSKPFEPQVATALVRRLLGEAPKVPGGDAAAAPSAAAAPVAAAGGSAAPDAIAVDDYFRRLDEALATAGLSTAPDNASDLAAIQVPVVSADRAMEAETLIVQRPAADAPKAAPGPDGETEEGPKLVDAFSALLDAEAGGSPGYVAGPVEMEGAPAPIAAPAVEWTPASGEAPVEAAAETVAIQAVAVDEPPAVAAGAGETVLDAPAAPEPVAAETADDAGSAPTMLAASAVIAAQPAAEAAEEPALPRTASRPPASLRADVAEHPALEGIDLDVFADAVAQKILHRLTDARIDAIVSERVLEIAERLVREEIERIKADAE